MKRKALLFGLFGLPLLTLLCCGGLLYQKFTFHVCTYEASEQLDDGLKIRISPQTRIENPSGLVGPPYWIAITLQNPPRSATKVVLHSLTITTDDGRVIIANVENSVHIIRDEPYGRFVVLYSTTDAGEWGRQPTLEAHYEIKGDDISASRRLRVRLRPKHKMSENIVSAV